MIKTINVLYKVTEKKKNELQWWRYFGNFPEKCFACSFGTDQSIVILNTQTFSTNRLVLYLLKVICIVITEVFLWMKIPLFLFCKYLHIYGLLMIEFSQNFYFSRYICSMRPGLKKKVMSLPQSLDWCIWLAIKSWFFKNFLFYFILFFLEFIAVSSHWGKIQLMWLFWEIFGFTKICLYV